MQLGVTCHGRPIRFEVQRIVNAGYTGRDRDAVERHIRELETHGVAAPTSIPALYPITSDRITIADSIEVIGHRTSGEAEAVLLCSGGTIYVGVGSDHTDRELERHDVQRSKQVCQNVLSPMVWMYEDVRDHWDALKISAWVSQGEERILYQRGSLAQLVPCEELLRIVGGRTFDGVLDGVVIYSGTIPSLTGELVFGDRFEIELADPTNGEALTCRYEVKPIGWLTDREE